MNFELVNPQTVDEAVAANENGARWFAGGTDLIPAIKSELVAPSRLVNLKRVEGLHGIHESTRGIHIGALTTLAQVAENEEIRLQWRALAQACELAASPQIRNMATLAGNLCQDSRCPYYRSGFHCYLRGGDTCFMRDGENREAAVIGYHDCVHVHPSDPANALVAFDAYLTVKGREGERTIAAQDFFRAPDANDHRMNVLNADEVIVEIVLPRVAATRRSVYHKAMDRAVWAFALTSAAVRVEVEDKKIVEARVILGGVAPTPWREFRIETALSGKNWDAESVTQELDDLLADARPLAHNSYKIRLARGVLKRALREAMNVDV